MTIRAAATIALLPSGAVYSRQKPTASPSSSARRAHVCRSPSPGGPNASVLIPLRAAYAPVRFSQKILGRDALDLRRKRGKITRHKIADGWHCVAAAAVDSPFRLLAQSLPGAAAHSRWHSFLLYLDPFRPR